MNDPTERLRELMALLDQGELTRSEFEFEAARVLSPGQTSSTERRPKRVGNYQITETIGEGGMGTVYRGHDSRPEWTRQHEGDVAIKVMHDHYASRPEWRERVT